MSLNPISELPMGFGMALVQNQSSLKYFEGLDSNEKQAVINKTHSINSKQEMKSFVDNLPNTTC